MGKKCDQSGRKSRSGHTYSEKNGRCTREILEWYSRGCERKHGKMSGLRIMCGVKWMQIALEWQRIGEAFMVMDDIKHHKESYSLRSRVYGLIVSRAALLSLALLRQITNQ
jgi:hypothetical protein